MRHPLLLGLPETIPTPRLLLRPYRAGDGAAYFPACRENRQHLLPFEANNPALKVSTPEDTEMLARRFAALWAAREAFFLAAWQDNTWTAQIYLGVVSWELPELELGFWVHQAQQGQGYVTEAARAALGLAFGTLGARRVCSECNETNARSIGVLQRLGFVREGLCREMRPDLLTPQGTPSGDLLFGLLAREFSGAAS